jgi:hypothetical protein
MRNIVPIVCLLVLVGCATPNSGVQSNSTMPSWMDRTEGELVSLWGTPNKTSSTPDGKRILTWETKAGDYGQLTCIRTFTVNQKGIIKGWSYENCPQ